MVQIVNFQCMPYTCCCCCCRRLSRDLNLAPDPVPAREAGVLMLAAGGALVGVMAVAVAAAPLLPPGARVAPRVGVPPRDRMDTSSSCSSSLALVGVAMTAEMSAAPLVLASPWSLPGLLSVEDSTAVGAVDDDEEDSSFRDMLSSRGRYGYAMARARI